MILDFLSKAVLLKSRHSVPLIFLCFALIVIWHPVILGGYSIVRSPIIEEGAPTYQNSPGWPVQDSYASAFQDEPWSVLIGKSVRSGELPIINMFNGLGAPLLETMQAGVFYPLNILLSLLPLSHPVAFDLFMLFHIFLFTYGLYALYSMFGNRWVAVFVALLIGGSGAVSMNSNMVHFRSFAWFPWILFFSFFAARSKNIWPLPLVTFAITCNLTAGSLQDSVISMSIAAVLIILYMFLYEQIRKPKEYIIQGIVVIAGFCFGSIGFASFFLSRSLHLLTLQEGMRALQHVNWYYMASWMFPKFKGIYPFFILSGTDQQNQPDLPTALWLLCFIGVCVAFLLIKKYFFVTGRRKNQAIFIVFLCLSITLGLLAVTHVSVLDFFQYIPFVQSLKFAKYHLWIIVLAGIVATWSVGAVSEFSMKNRRFIVVSGVGVICLVAIALYATAVFNGAALGQSLFLSFPLPIQQELIITTVLNIFLFMIVIVILYRPLLHGDRAWVTLSIYVVIVSAGMFPFGWYERPATWTSPVHEAVLAQAVYQVQSISEDPEDRPRLLLGNPTGNLALIPGFETISVWDPILNRAYQDFFTAHFQVDNKDLLLQPARAIALRQEQINALRFLGVDAVNGYSTAGVYKNISEKNIGGEPVLFIDHSLPRVFFLTLDQYDHILHLEKNNETLDMILGTLLEYIESNKNNGTIIDVDQVRTNGIVAHSTAHADGYIIALQAVMPSWRLNQKSTDLSFLHVYPMWRVSQTTAFQSMDISYEIPGKKLIMMLFFSGLVLLTCAILYKKKSR